MHVGGPGCQDSDCCLAERKPNRLRKTRTAYLSTGVRSYNRNGIAALKVCGRGLLFRPSGAYSTITAHPMLTPWAAFVNPCIIFWCKPLTQLTPPFIDPRSVWLGNKVLFEQVAFQTIKIALEY